MKLFSPPCDFFSILSFLPLPLIAPFHSKVLLLVTCRRREISRMCVMNFFMCTTLLRHNNATRRRLASFTQLMNMNTSCQSARESSKQKKKKQESECHACMCSGKDDKAGVKLLYRPFVLHPCNKVQSTAACIKKQKILCEEQHKKCRLFVILLPHCYCCCLRILNLRNQG